MAIREYTSDERKRIEALKKEREKLWNQRSLADTRSCDDTHDLFLGRDIDKIDKKIADIESVAHWRWKYD